MNDLFRGLVIANIRRTLAAADMLTTGLSDGLVGRAREIFVQDLLVPHLPPSMGIATGAVVDSHGVSSPQIDVIIFDKEIVPPAMLRVGEGIAPFESVLAMIEVKSTVEMVDIRQAVAYSASIAKMKAHPSANPADPFCEKLTGDFVFQPPAVALFGYYTSLKDGERTELDRVVEISREAGWKGDVPPIQAICIARKESHVFGPKRLGVAPRWRTVASTEEHEEVIVFLATILNTCRTLSLTRGKCYTGVYLIEDSAIPE